MNAERLIAAWRTWAAGPAGAYYAGRLEDEVQAVARSLGTTGSALRDAVTARLGAGAGLADAVRAAVEKFPTEAAA